VARQSSESFDEHERPTAQRSRPEGGDDPNATTRIKPFDLEQLVQKGSGTRPVITSEQIDRYMQERASSDERLTTPVPEMPKVETDDPRERETVDALTLQRETLVIKAPEAQQIPIDIDLSRLHIPSPRPAAGRPVPLTDRLRARLDQRTLTIAAGFLIAMVSALLGFVAGRL
jgi:hypothetical protein